MEDRLDEHITKRRRRRPILYFRKAIMAKPKFPDQAWEGQDLTWWLAERHAERPARA